VVTREDNGVVPSAPQPKPVPLYAVYGAGVIGTRAVAQGGFFAGLHPQDAAGMAGVLLLQADNAVFGGALSVKAMHQPCLLESMATHSHFRQILRMV